MTQDVNTYQAEHPKAVQAILTKIESVLLGKSSQCRLALTCLLAQGHLLIEDLPGMGKTTLAHTLASTLGLSYQRTQFTSDLLPGDVVGISIFNTDNNQFELHKGPIFNQVVLADEINRASPKTQSALLEAMAENQVSIDGTTHQLPSPFFVIATQNPLFHSGTYPLPESQLDRFMMRLSLGFPDIKAERKILSQQIDTTAKQSEEAIIDQDTLLVMQKAVQNVNVSPDVIDYIIALSQVTRGGNNASNNQEEIQCKPLSPRATKALLSAAKASAFIDERDFVLPDDVQAVFYVVCQHRIEMSANYSTGHYHDQEQKIANSVSTKILTTIDVLNPLGF
jgi:MoxR-like ATPase